MELKQLIEDINKIHQSFVEKSPDRDMEMHSLLRSVKLSEEVGELNEQILLHFGHGRKEKLERYSMENMEDEIADVIFSVGMLAKSLDADMEKAIIRKMEKIKERLGIKD